MTTIINILKLVASVLGLLKDIYTGNWIVRWSVNCGAIWYGFTMLVNWATTLGHGLKAMQGGF